MRKGEGDNGLTDEWINGATMLDMMEGKGPTEKREMDHLT